MGEVRLRPVTFSELSDLRHEVAVSEDPQFRRPEFLVIRYYGVYRHGSAGRGDALYDLAVLTLGHQEHLADVVAGYGSDVDLDVIRAWWSLRSLCGVRWLAEHGYGSPEEFPEVDVLRSQL